MPDDEVARREALAAALWGQKTFPPLYRVSTMDPETVLHATFGSSTVWTHDIFTREDGRLHRPRLEVHTFEAGSAGVHAPILWRMNFGTVVPVSSGKTESVPVTVSGSSLTGLLRAATTGGWMVSVEAPDAVLLVMGSGESPSPLSLEQVDLRTLKRSESRNSGMAEE